MYSTRRPARASEGGGLQEQSGLADAGVAAHQHGGGRDQAAAEHAIQFGDAGLGAGRRCCRALQADEFHPGRLACFRGAGAVLHRLLDDGVPLPASIAASGPFAGHGAAGLADIACGGVWPSSPVHPAPGPPGQLGRQPSVAGRGQKLPMEQHAMSDTKPTPPPTEDEELDDRARRVVPGKRSAQPDRPCEWDRQTQPRVTPKQVSLFSRRGRPGWPTRRATCPSAALSRSGTPWPRSRRGWGGASRPVRQWCFRGRTRPSCHPSPGRAWHGRSRRRRRTGHRCG